MSNHQGNDLVITLVAWCVGAACLLAALTALRHGSLVLLVVAGICGAAWLSLLDFWAEGEPSPSVIQHPDVEPQVTPPPPTAAQVAATNRTNVLAAAKAAANAHAIVKDAEWANDLRADARRVIGAAHKGERAYLNHHDTWPEPHAQWAALDEAGAKAHQRARYARRNTFRNELSAKCETEARQILEAREAARKERLSKPIPLLSHPAGVVFGTDVASGDDLRVPLREIPHLLVVGTSGFGKSVFLHQLISQLVGEASQHTHPAEISSVILVDLKGGVEFDRYAAKNDKVQVVWRYDDVVAAVDQLTALMLERQVIMKDESRRNWPGGRIFFIVDEFAQIQLWPTLTADEKATHKRLIADLTRLSMLGRSMGIVLVVAIQKPTTDVMDSSFRGNLQGQVLFRVASRQLAATVLPSLDDAPVDPVTLKRGRCLFYNANTGITHRLQVHVAPEAME